MNEEKNTGQKSRYVVLISIIITLLAITIFLLILSQNKTTSKITTTEKGGISYKVCLKPNEYYPDKCLDEGMQYVANIIDYINIGFEYELVTDKKVNYEYIYRIDAEVRVFAKNDPSNVIYTKTNELLKEKIEKIENKQLLKIIENVQIDYDEYNNLVRNFKTDYGVNASSDIKIKVYIQPVIKYERIEEEIKVEDKVMELTIPLTENQININMATEDINYSEEYKVEITTMLNYIYLGGSAISGIIMLLVVIGLIMSITKPFRSRTPYQKEIDKILREYDDIISESETIIDPDETEYRYIDYKSFKEIKDMALNIGKQIIFSELKQLKELPRSWFYIIDENSKIIHRVCIDSKEERFKN